MYDLFYFLRTEDLGSVVQNLQCQKLKLQTLILKTCKKNFLLCEKLLLSYFFQQKLSVFLGIKL